MLYIDTLDSHRNESKEAIQSLFHKVKKNQSYENDLLLVLLNGFYNESLVGSGLSPFMFGPGIESYTEQTQYDFFHSFRTTYLQKSKAEFLKDKQLNDDWYRAYHTITQLEMLVYLKLWESDLLLKQMYNLCCRLLHGNPYDWYKTTKGEGRKYLIEDQIIKRCKNKAPKFYHFVSSIYNRQIRNAAAHSQFHISGDSISFTNHNPGDNHNLHQLSVDEWETIFHRTVLFYNSFIGTSQGYFQKYKDEAKYEHFGKKIRTTRSDGNQSYEWVKYLSDRDRWIWYENWNETNGII